MNERIGKLIEQCTSSFVNMHGEWEDDFDKEKFAELIVRECANIVNSLEQYEGQGDCSTAEYIKERFGVEE